jgi:hypothetical protein
MLSITFLSICNYLVEMQNCQSKYVENVCIVAVTRWQLTWWRLRAVAGSLPFARERNSQVCTAVCAVLHPPSRKTARYATAFLLFSFFFFFFSFEKIIIIRSICRECPFFDVKFLLRLLYHWLQQCKI